MLLLQYVRQIHIHELITHVAPTLYKGQVYPTNLTVVVETQHLNVVTRECAAAFHISE
jgi:hypothetical protein